MVCLDWKILLLSGLNPAFHAHLFYKKQFMNFKIAQKRKDK